MSEIVQHSSKTNEHYTPVPYIEAARLTMGSIDLDPATTAEVNGRTVLASQFFTKEDDGMSKVWFGNVFLNPPGGVTKNRSNAALWWNRLQKAYYTGEIAQAVFVGFTLEILRSTQDCHIWIGAASAVCYPKSRIQFLDEQFEPQKHPGHANIVAYLGPRKEQFVSEFERFGKCRI